MISNSSSFTLHNWEEYHQEDLCRRIVENVQYFGICVLPSFFSESFCQSAIEDVKRLERLTSVKTWQDPLCADKRVMGIGQLASHLEMRDHAIINKVISLLYGEQPQAGFTMSGHLKYVEGNLGSGQGWHRDSVNNDQFKSITFLSDVDSSAGPFQYYLRTASTRSMQACEKRYGISSTANRITVDPKCLLPKTRFVELMAKAGTLVFVNTRAIHRGKPIEVGERFALTTYHWKRTIPAHIQKIVN